MHACFPHCDCGETLCALCTRSSGQADRRSALAALAEELAAATAALREREEDLEALRAVSLRGEAALQACMGQLQVRAHLRNVLFRRTPITSKAHALLYARDW